MSPERTDERSGCELRGGNVSGQLEKSSGIPAAAAAVFSNSGTPSWRPPFGENASKQAGLNSSNVTSPQQTASNGVPYGQEGSSKPKALSGQRDNNDNNNNDNNDNNNSNNTCNLTRSGKLLFQQLRALCDDSV
eukprot:CAMPEP_0206469462 /NCGR_PEP_ID=MMETSP0324_2-20121206/30295_1 /ASSEMBLY_ACC=CAM_ASM_000836 /TAXON_ID=2866 /ORGANISM="Crypthecodinium cohnii, Strain Seligo" /LENGTH=133 /DNA_ID=CAMNT_0053943227 /DNA_START=44 /DNA_END=446 /DNA_ORIENTATION=-